MNWSDLSMKDRASYIKLAVENGIYNLSSIRTIYNSFAEGGSIKAMRATPTLKKKSWETDEEYKERISSYSKVDTAAIIAENQRNRQQYLQTEEGKRRQAQIQETSLNLDMIL